MVLWLQYKEVTLKERKKLINQALNIAVSRLSGIILFSLKIYPPLQKRLNYTYFFVHITI